MADVGRPLKFSSVEELEQKIEAYFDSCFEEVWEERRLDNGETEWKRKYSHTGEPMIKQVSPFTLSGLAVHIGCDRKTLLNYSHRDEYFPTIKMAKARIEAYVESELFSGKPAAGAIFNLKNNYDWSDKQDVALSGSMHNTTQDVGSMTPEERRARIDELERRRRIGTDPAIGE